MDLLKARAKGMTDGCEPDLTIVVDPIFPIAVLTRAMPALQKRFPETAIKLYVEPWGAVIQHVLDGRCAIGVMGSLVTTPPQVAREGLMEVRLVTVVSPEHPLARHRGTIPTATLAKHIQLMHTDRSNLLPGRDSGLVSPKMWLIAHIEFKREFVLAGFGFALMPLHMIEQELASGALVQISVEDAPRFFGNPVEMSAIYRVDNPPGPAGRWLIDRLMQENGQRLDKSSGLSSAAGKPKSVRRRIRGSGHTR